MEDKKRMLILIANEMRPDVSLDEKMLHDDWFVDILQRAILHKHNERIQIERALNGVMYSCKWNAVNVSNNHEVANSIENA